MKAKRLKSTLEPVNTLVESRSRALSLVRQFFYERGFSEVDVPQLAKAPCVDVFIDPFSTKDDLYLHTSPEIAMKRLLCRGAKEIFFLGHVFRKEEIGRLHSSEFTMIEWYRTDSSKELFLQESVDLCVLFLGELKFELIDYHKAFELFSTGKEPPYDWSERDKRDYIWSHEVEPQLGKGKLSIVTNYPKEDAALAKLHDVDGKLLAERFEIYFEGVELGNGYHELSDAVEQKKRFEEASSLRAKEGKEVLPQDKKFLDDLACGLPPNTYGMSLGFDRLLLLKEKKQNLSEVVLLPDTLA